jgi:hypothetical protein
MIICEHLTATHHKRLPFIMTRQLVCACRTFDEDNRFTDEA